MTIHFGNDFDGPFIGMPANIQAGELVAGPNKLLHWLEAQLALEGYSNSTNYLRIELYRQALSQVENAFYSGSYEADRFATAEYLLDWRDELLMAGWNFEKSTSMPVRLEALATAEEYFQKKINSPEFSRHAQGLSDRYEQVLKLLPHSKIKIDKLVFHEPLALQKPVIQRFVSILRTIASIEISEPGESDFQFSPSAQLFVLKCRRDSDAAVFLSQLLRENSPFSPCILLPAANLALEQSFGAESMASMGIHSASLARPSLQVLKLAPAFLWEPVDVFKIMEFLTLSLKPLDTGLALEIARVMSEKPGFFSDNWFAAVFGYLESMNTPEGARSQYEFWFDRKRYSADASAPKQDAISIYSYLNHWARRYYEELGSNNNSLLVLSEQALHIHELLEAVPEQRITFLELERIVRTVFEATSIQLAPAEKGSLKYIHKPGAIAGEIANMVWWNFVEGSESHPPDKWREEERLWLSGQKVALQTAQAYSRMQLLLKQRPFHKCTEKMLVIVPEMVDGAEVMPHLLLSDLEVSLKNQYQSLVYNIDLEEDRERLRAHFKVPESEQIEMRQELRSKPMLQIYEPDKMLAVEYETPTNLETLCYYPHRWFFRQKLRLFPSSLLSVKSENTLLGSLAHRFFEVLLKTDTSTLNKQSLAQWVEQQAQILLPREGATLLLYGREPERNSFLNRVKTAAWNLILLLRSNEWTVSNTELAIETLIGPLPIKGKADLVLQRGAEQAIVDLKWSGAKRRKELMQNKEDLQLVLYAKMLPPEDSWPHTAYFILDEGKIIARNNLAFKEAVLAGRNQEDHVSDFEAIFQKIQRTYQWRLTQVQNGKIEIRTLRTAQELEAIYEGQLFELLEMKNEDSRWDDYRVLIA